MQYQAVVLISYQILINGNMYMMYMIN